MYVTDCLRFLIGGKAVRYVDLIDGLYAGRRVSNEESAEDIIKRMSAGLEALREGGESDGDTI